MVIKNDIDNASTSPAYINVSSSIKLDKDSDAAGTSIDEQTRAKEITEYLVTLDGSPDAFERYEPQARRLLHPNLAVLSDEKEIQLEDFIALVRDNYIANGCIAKLQAIQHNKDGTVTVTIKNYLPGEEGDVTRQLIHFADDGRIERVEGENETNQHKFGSVLDRVAALPTEVEVVASKFKAFLDYVSKDATIDKDKLQSIIDGLYASEAVIIADGRNENLDYFKVTIGAVVAAGSYTRDVKVEVIGPNTILIDFYVEGPSLDGPVPVRRIITERNGKVISSRVAKNTKDSFPV